MPTALDKLQGIWNVTELEVDGSPMPAAGQIEVDGDRFVSTGMGATYEGKIVVDTAQKPAAIDLKFTKGPEKGNTNRGIFEFHGDGWRLCLQTTGKDRPKKFATTAGSGLALETLERRKDTAKSTGKKSALPPAGDPVPELEGEWQMVAHSTNGSPLDPQWVAMGRRIANGDEVKVMMGPQTQVHARYSIDRKAKPNTMDYRLAGGKTQLGLFELKGDTLQTCFAAPGKPRPKSLGEGYTVTTWKRL